MLLLPLHFSLQIRSLKVFPLYIANMKIKFQGQEHVSPLETFVLDIGDSEVQHLDFGDFWNKLNSPNPSPMAQMINEIDLAYVAVFPISV